MELESKIFIQKKGNLKPERSSYKLEGLGGTGKLVLTKGFDSTGLYCIDLKCEAGIKKFLKLFNFEAKSFWEKQPDGTLRFVSFEEKDLVKNIYKKWEFSSNQLQYSENKKGVTQEREISYSVAGLKPEHRAFDPLSVVALLSFENVQDGQTLEIFLFGKQQLLKLELQISKVENMNRAVLKPVQGLNPKWEKTLLNTEISLTAEGQIEEIIVPSPLHFGKIHMILEKRDNISTSELDQIISSK